MFSYENYKPSEDGFKGVNPIVILEDKEMTVVWGDSKSAGGTEKVWKAIVFHRSPEVVSAVSLDADRSGSAAMLYTMNLKRGYLYMSAHKDNPIMDSSSASTFISECSK